MANTPPDHRLLTGSTELGEDTIFGFAADITAIQGEDFRTLADAESVDVIALAEHCDFDQSAPALHSSATASH